MSMSVIQEFSLLHIILVTLVILKSLFLLFVVVLTSWHFLRIQTGPVLLAENERLVTGGLGVGPGGEADVEGAAVHGVGVAVVVTKPQGTDNLGNASKPSQAQTKPVHCRTVPSPAPPLDR